MTQVDSPPILALTATVSIDAGENSDDILYPIAAPFQIEYVAITTASGGGAGLIAGETIDVYILDGLRDGGLRYKYINEGVPTIEELPFAPATFIFNLLDNLLKPIPMGAVYVNFDTANPQAVQVAKVIVTGAPAQNDGNPYLELAIQNNSAQDIVLDVEIGYRITGRSIDIVPQQTRMLNLNQNLGLLQARSGLNLTGASFTTLGSPLVTGIGTLYTLECAVGDRLQFADFIAVIHSITDNTHLTLEELATQTISGATFIDLDSGFNVSEPANELNSGAE